VKEQLSYSLDSGRYESLCGFRPAFKRWSGWDFKWP